MGMSTTGAREESRGDLAKQLTAESVTKFILGYGQNHGPGFSQAMSCCIRSFLGYCQLNEILDRDFSALIPTVHRWQLANTPKKVYKLPKICRQNAFEYTHLKD